MLEALTSYTEITFKEISLFSYLIVFLGGVLTSFTPCVYPLIPVTAGYIGATSAGNKRRAFLISFLYVLGIAFTYSCLGAVAALGGMLFGEISASPWTYLIIGNIFLLLAFSMMGFFVIPLPKFLKQPISSTNKKGLFAPFLVGVSAGFVIGPCTAPILGAVLTYIAGKQNLFLGVSMLFTYALGMGMLLLVIGTFTGLLSSLPKSGKWLDIIKKVFGIILIICAEYFILQAGMRF